MNLRMLVILALLLVCTVETAAGVAQNENELSVTRVFDRLSEAWHSGDGSAWADEFVGDADFTVWFGLRMKGKEAIAQGHQFIFDRFYRQTRLVIDVRQIRILNADTAIVHLEMSVIKAGEDSPEAPDVVPMAVLERTGTDWKIVAFQNTPKLDSSLGDIRQFKKMLAAAKDAQ